MKPSGALFLLSVLTIHLCFPKHAIAQDFKCPEPIKQISNNIKGDLNGEAQTIIKLGAMEIKGKFESTVVDLFSKYRNADELAIAQNLLSTACHILKTATDMSGKEKYEKWLLIFPLMDKYFPDKRSLIVPEPGETKGIYISYQKSFYDSDLILDTFKSAGIRVDVKESDCRSCKTTSLFCAPNTPREAILKVALTLFDAGVRLTRVTPGHLPVGIDPPTIELNAHVGEELRPLSRSQIEAVTDCYQEYTAEGTSRRLLIVENGCPDVLYLWYLTLNSETSQWNSIRNDSFIANEAGFLTDEAGAFALIESNLMYFYAEAGESGGANETNDQDFMFVWSGSKDDGTSVLQSLEDGRNVYFQRQAFRVTGAPGGFSVAFTCPSQR